MKSLLLFEGCFLLGMSIGAFVKIDPTSGCVFLTLATLAFLARARIKEHAK
jgi:hypothetical protein